MRDIISQRKGGTLLKSKYSLYDSKFSRFITRLMELVLLNFVFILTCIPIFTIGASITALYSIILKMIRNEEGYIIRGYFKDFVKNFKQATVFWLIAMLLYFMLYIIYLAAAIDGGLLFTIYIVITWVLGILYSFFFHFTFPLIATFKNTVKDIAQNTIFMTIAHFPIVLLSYLSVFIPLFLSFGINTKIMQYALLFWILIGFSAVTFLSSLYLNRIFLRYMKANE